MPGLADLSGTLLVARLGFARAQRRRRRHLLRFLGAAVLVVSGWGLLAAASGRPARKHCPG